MKKSKIGAALLGSMLLLPFSAHAVCIDMQVNLEGLPESSDQSNQTPKATMLLRCMGGTQVIPGSTLLQTVREHNGRMCYSDMACGNTSNWSGYVALSGTWIFYESVFSFITSQEGQQTIVSGKRDYNGQNTGVRVGMEWGQITRNCKPISPEMCL